AAEVLRRLPRKIVAPVLAMGDVQVHGACGAAAARTVAVEVEPMTVGSKVHRKIVARGVDVIAEILRRAPVCIEAGPLGNPDIEFPECAGAVRAVVQAQPILGDRWMLVVQTGVDRGAEIDWRGPVRELLCLCLARGWTPQCNQDSHT